MVTKGVISAYEICWKMKNSMDAFIDCNPKKSSGADRNYFIEKLQPGTIYIVTVTVKAFTSAGYGPEDKKESETVKSGKLPAFIYNPVRNC